MNSRGWLILAIELLLSVVLVYELMGQVNAEKKRADAAESLAVQLQADNDRQSSVIATQSLQFNRYNQIAAAVHQYDIKITASAQEKQIVYREILKTEPTCALDVPAALAGRLLDYANSLRASAMHSYSGIVDSAGPASATTGTLTYCQAVLWIDPLLTAIDKANSQLKGIRDIESSRQER